MIRLLVLLIVVAPVWAGEVEIAREWCDARGGQAEHPLAEPFGPPTRVDCLTDSTAWEVEWAPKWAESIGQARYYAARTGRAAGVVLMMRDQGDMRYLARWLIARGDLAVTLELHYPSSP